jgi:tRNA-specific 2-thiouridylase
VPGSPRRRRSRVLAALSGGVDSTVAAALMLAEGHEVVGVTLDQWAGPGCPSPVEPARRAADQLGIEFEVLDCRAPFSARVVDAFGASYLAGSTPNPCVVCNRVIRFPTLLAEASRLGCDLVITGHHARVEVGRGGRRLLRAADEAKDQSYFLHTLGQADLDRVRFPVGGMAKSEVRALAGSLGLSAASEVESQDLCFVGPEGYRAFLMARFPEAVRPGPVVDLDGREIGRHQGTVGYTVGQRRGLGIAMGEPRFVVEVRPGSATVVVGGAADLLSAGCLVAGLSFVSGNPPGDPQVEAKVRYRSPMVPARLEAGEAGEWLVSFDRPQTAVTPGQAAVFYRGDEVLGGGTILSVPRLRV